MSPGWFAFVVLLPLWAVAGFGDYLCHRATRIAATPFGAGESLLHLLQWVQVVIPAAALLLFGLQIWTIVVAAAFVAAHSATAWWDERRARPQRFISVAENHCHAYLISIPVVGWLYAVWIYASQGSVAPLSSAWIAGTVIVVFLASGGVIGEELWRCARNRFRNSERFDAAKPARGEAEGRARESADPGVESESQS
jgi:hypothetical protein